MIRLTKLLFALILSASLLVGQTNSFYTDTETLTDINLGSGSVNIDLVNTSDSQISSPFINQSDIIPGYQNSHSFKIKKTGTLDFQYKIDIIQTGGDASLCQNIDLVLKKGIIAKYTGKLSDFNSSEIYSYTDTDDTWSVDTSFDNDAADMRQKSCIFSISVDAWQIGSDGTWGFTDRESLNNSITTGTWNVDHTVPSSTITKPFNSNGDNKIQFVYLWNGRVEGTASDDLSGVHHVELSIERTLLGLFWDGNSWEYGNESSTRVIADGTTSWSYNVNVFIPFGRFRIIAHAVDNAGNIENSAVIEFENLDNPSPVLETNLSSSRHYYTFAVDNISDYTDLKYEITYETDSSDKGLSGSAKLENQKEYKKENIVLGSVSSGGGIAFDQGVKNIVINVLLTKNDGSSLVLANTIE